MEAYIVEAVRTPRGKINKSLSHLMSVQLLEPLYRAVFQRTGLEPGEVDNLILGCNTAVDDQGANIARVSALYSQLGEQIPGATLNRYCCSGLDACNMAAASVAVGMEDLVLAGGVESLSRVPIFSDRGAWFQNPEVAAATHFVPMGIAADLLASMEHYSREQLDETAKQSHQRAAAAWERGFFSRALAPVPGPEGLPPLTHDEAVRPNLDPAKLASLEPSFANNAAGFVQLALQTYPEVLQINHVHHPGNSPALTDGASLLLIASKAGLERLDLKPLAKISGYANATCEPVLMLTGHIHAARKLLHKHHLSSQDVDLWEVNESFAASALKFRLDLEIPEDRFNVNGGAMAMGHPLGATGGVLITTLVDELRRRGLKRGIAAIPGGAGVGVATLIECFNT